MNQVVSCLLLSLEEKKIILPTAAVSEIIVYETPEFVPDTPVWFLGILTWRGIHMPLVNLETIAPFSVWLQKVEINSVEEKSREKEKYIAVLNRIQKPTNREGLDAGHQYPFFSILINGSPKLYRLNQGEIKMVDEEISKSSKFLMGVELKDSKALIPNLEYFWKIIDELPRRLQWFSQKAF